MGLERLRAKAEVFVAANWSYLFEDTRLTKKLETVTLCRIHQLAGRMHAAPLWYSTVLPGVAYACNVHKAELEALSDGAKLGLETMQSRYGVEWQTVQVLLSR